MAPSCGFGKDITNQTPSKRAKINATSHSAPKDYGEIDGCKPSTSVPAIIFSEYHPTEHAAEETTEHQLNGSQLPQIKKVQELHRDGEGETSATEVYQTQNLSSFVLTPGVQENTQEHVPTSGVHENTQEHVPTPGVHENTQELASQEVHKDNSGSGINNQLEINTITLLISINNRLDNLENKVGEIVHYLKSNKIEETAVELMQMIRNLIDSSVKKVLEKDENFVKPKKITTINQLKHLNKQLKDQNFMKQMVS